MENERSGVRVRVEALDADAEARATDLAQRLGLPLGGEADFSLQCGVQCGTQFGRFGLQLVDLHPGAPGPVRVDFVGGAVGHRRQFGGGSGQMIARAIGVQPGVRPTVLDATAGLGRDAFVLATLGCVVTLIERQPLIAVLLEDGLARAREDAEIAPIIARMDLRVGDAIQMMRAWEGEAPQVIYLDPMFPHRDKSALVKKEMRLFRPLVGDDLDADELLDAALALASHRVVVKRPRKAPPLGERKPSHVLSGKSVRFDVYTLGSFA